MRTSPQDDPVPGARALRLLLLAGTTEARAIARALAGQRGVEVIASLAGATRRPEALGVDTRVGGFGDAEGFAAWLAHERIGAVLDATHPFAARISRRCADICARMDVAHAQLLRPEWRAGPGDDWVELETEEAAGRVIPRGSVVFLATGRQNLDRFAGLSDRTLWARRIDAAPEPFPFPRGDWVVGRPPFAIADEIALFRRLGVDWLVVKNAGGEASRSKLDAARALGIRVAMIRRPPQPECTRVETVAGALEWVRARLP